LASIRLRLLTCPRLTATDVAGRAHRLLQERTELPTELEQEIDTCIKRLLPLPPSNSSASNTNRLDQLGTHLWNAATTLIRADEQGDRLRGSPRKAPRMHVLLRVFGFLLVDAAYCSTIERARNHEQRIRTLKIALKASRFSLDHGESDLALKALERVSQYISAAENEVPIVQLACDAEDNRARLKPLTSEYHLLRMTHAFQTGRLDLAGHFFDKASQMDTADDTQLAEKAADLCHRIAKSLIKARQWKAAENWSDRAISALDHCHEDGFGTDLSDLRLAITSTLVDCLITDGSSEALERGFSMVDQLAFDFGLQNRITVSLMRFKLLCAGKEPDVPQAEAAIAQMLRSAIITDKTFKVYVEHTILWEASALTLEVQDHADNTQAQAYRFAQRFAINIPFHRSSTLIRHAR
jgi:hypothetical protein